MENIIKVKVGNGIIVDAVVIEEIGHILICYAQNRLFTVLNYDGELNYSKIISDYCIIPEYDSELKYYSEYSEEC